MIELRRAWLEDLLPEREVACLAGESWARWGLVELSGTKVTLEVPPGPRRCAFLETSEGDVVGVQVPRAPRKVARELSVSPR